MMYLMVKDYAFIFVVVIINMLLDGVLCVTSIKLSGNIQNTLIFIGIVEILSFMPYYTMFKSIRGNVKNKVHIMTEISIVSALGIYAKYDILFIHPDAQGAIGYALVPIIQLVVIGAIYLFFIAIASFKLK